MGPLRKCIDKLLSQLDQDLVELGWESLSGPEDISGNRVFSWEQLGGWCIRRIEVAFKRDRPDIVTISFIVRAEIGSEEILVDARDLAWLVDREQGCRLPQVATVLRCSGFVSRISSNLRQAVSDFFDRYESVGEAQKEVERGRTIHGSSRNRDVKLLMSLGEGEPKRLPREVPPPSKNPPKKT